MRIPYRGAGIALFYNDSEYDYVLLGRRSDYPFHNRWSVPGGYFERNSDKSCLDNAIREFNEETGIDFNKINVVKSGSWKLRFPLFTWTTFFYKTDSKEYTLKPNEFFELKWIRVCDIKNYPLRPFTESEIRTFYKGRR